MKKSVKFIAIYAAQIGTIWGLLEAYSYFKGDALRVFLGPYWVLIYIFPLITTAYLVARGDKKEDKVEESITTQGDFSPGRVGGNYTVQMPSGDTAETKSLGSHPADNRRSAAGEEANQSIRTKGNYSPGKVEGDYKIDG